MLGMGWRGSPRTGGIIVVEDGVVASPIVEASRASLVDACLDLGAAARCAATQATR